jgi:hypothetical protein
MKMILAKHDGGASVSAHEIPGFRLVWPCGCGSPGSELTQGIKTFEHCQEKVFGESACTTKNGCGSAQTQSPICQ